MAEVTWVRWPETLEGALLDKPRDVSELERLLDDPGWKQVEKLATATIKVWENLLLQPNTTRKDQYPDDYLRGRIDALKRLVTWPRSVVEQHNELVTEDIEAEMIAKANDHRVRLGYRYPLTYQESAG